MIDPQAKAEAALARLVALGFDKSYVDLDMDEEVDPADRRIRLSPRCSQCEVLVISGTPCHETGCPRETKSCRGCNTQIPARGGRYCGDCV